MVTIMVCCSIFLAIVAIAVVVSGLVALSPIFAVIVCLPLIDVLMLKLIFGKKKKRKEK